MSDSFELREPQPLETMSPESRLSPFQLIRRHYWLLILGAVVGCVVGALFYSRLTPTYQSSSQILVVNRSQSGGLPTPAISGSGMETGYAAEDFLSTHQTLIRSPLLVADAVKESKLATLPSFAGRGDPTGTIIQNLKLSQETNANKPTSILNLSFRGPQPQDTATVLTAIIDSYQRFLQGRYRSVADETAKLILEANTLLEKKIATKQQEYDEFLAKLPTDLWKGKDGFNPMQLQIMNLETKRVDLLNREADLQGRLQALERAMKDGRHSRAELLTMMSQAQSPGANGIRENTSVQTTERLMALKLKEKNLLEDFGPHHPEVLAVRDELALLRGRVKFSDKDSGIGDDLGADPLQSHFQALKLELEYIRMASGSLGKMLEEVHRQAKPMRSLDIRNESFRTELARNQQLFDSIAKRVDEMNILTNANGGYEAEVINPPSVGIKVAPNAIFVFAFALLLGVAAGCGMAYLAEMSDQSFRTPEEIRRRLGLPVVGHIPTFVPEDGENLLAAGGLSIDPSLCTAHRSKSREAEAYRGVRTALFFNRGGGHSVIQVTSPDMGDGKSTLIGNLAVSIAQAEKKVILIDADFRRPRVHKLFNLSAEQGMASVMSGEAELTDVIKESPIPGLSILPCGPIPPNPAELLSLPRFKELLGVLREKYDYVLIDTPPLLAVTDPCVVTPYVDGVILTVRISKNARPSATRAKEILSALGANVIGVVVNGVGADSKGYGYGGYRYGYGGYRYGYGQYYTYSSYENDDASTANGDHEGSMLENGTADPARKQSTVAGRSSRKKSGFFNWFLN